MKQGLLLAAVIFGLSTAAYAHGNDEFYVSGPASLVPAQTGLNTDIWVGGDVAELLFESMTAAASQVDPASQDEARLGEHVQCLHSPSNKAVEYSCTIEVEVATGKAVKK